MFKFVARANCGHLLGKACIAPYSFVEFVVAVLALSQISVEIFPMQDCVVGPYFGEETERVGCGMLKQVYIFSTFWLVGHVSILGYTTCLLK